MSIQYSEIYYNNHIAAHGHLIDISMKLLYYIFIANTGAIIVISGYIKGEFDKSLIESSFCSVNYFMLGIIIVFIALIFNFLLFRKVSSDNVMRTHYHKANEDYLNLYKNYLENENNPNYSKELLVSDNSYLKYLHDYIKKVESKFSKKNVKKNTRYLIGLEIITSTLVLTSILFFLGGSYKFINSLNDFATRLQDEPTPKEIKVAN